MRIPSENEYRIVYIIHSIFVEYNAQLKTVSLKKYN